MHCDCQASQSLNGGSRGPCSLTQSWPRWGPCSGAGRPGDAEFCFTSALYNDLRPRSLAPCEGGRAADGRVLGMLLLASEKDLAEADTRCDSVMPVPPRIWTMNNTPGSIPRGQMSDNCDSVMAYRRAGNLAMIIWSFHDTDSRLRVSAPGDAVLCRHSLLMKPSCSRHIKVAPG